MTLAVWGLSIAFFGFAFGELVGCSIYLTRMPTLSKILIGIALFLGFAYSVYQACRAVEIL